MTTLEEVKRTFMPVDPKTVTEQQRQGILLVQNAFIELASTLITDVPDCADRKAALAKILVAKFLCVQAITHVGYLTEEERKANEEAAKKATPNIVSGPTRRK